MKKYIINTTGFDYRHRQVENNKINTNLNKNTKETNTWT